MDYPFWIRLITLQSIVGVCYFGLWLLIGEDMFSHPLKVTLLCGVSVFLGTMVWLRVFPGLEWRWKHRNRTKEGGKND